MPDPLILDGGRGVELAATLVREAATGEAPGPRAPRILVVDDDLSAVILMRRLLAQLGDAVVRCVTAPADAVAAFTDFEPDLVILDVWMPGLDGLALLDRLRAEHAERGPVPIVMLSGDPDPLTARQALLLGATTFVQKPFDATQMSASIRRLLTGAPGAFSLAARG